MWFSNAFELQLKNAHLYFHMALPKMGTQKFLQYKCVYDILKMWKVVLNKLCLIKQKVVAKNK